MCKSTHFYDQLIKRGYDKAAVQAHKDFASKKKLDSIIEDAYEASLPIAYADEREKIREMLEDEQDRLESQSIGEKRMENVNLSMAHAEGFAKALDLLASLS